MLSEFQKRHIQQTLIAHAKAGRGKCCCKICKQYIPDTSNETLRFRAMMIDRALWNLACDFDQIERTASFVVFRDGNSWIKLANDYRCTGIAPIGFSLV